MDASQIYILIAVLALLIIAILMFFVKKSKKKTQISPLAGIAFAFVISGIIFNEDRLIGYGLMGIGVLLSIVDVFIKKKKR